MIAVVALGVWMTAVAIVLRALHRADAVVTPTPPAEVLPEVPEWAAPEFWTQDRVDAQFRAMTAPLSR